MNYSPFIIIVSTYPIHISLPFVSNFIVHTMSKEIQIYLDMFKHIHHLIICQNEDINQHNINILLDCIFENTNMYTIINDSIHHIQSNLISPNITYKKINLQGTFNPTLYGCVHSGTCNILFQISAYIDFSIRHSFNLVLIDKGINSKQASKEIFESYFKFEKYVPYGIEYINILDQCYRYIDVENTGKDILYNGYMQNLKYIKRYTPLWQFLLQTNNLSILNNLCYIHIRYGDYINNPFHYIDLKSGIKKLISQHQNFKFAFISDDISLLKENISTFIPDKGITDYYIYEETDVIKTLRFMSQCVMGICSNSTFSLWGGILNPNTNKKIYIPEIWLPEIKTNKEHIANALNESWITFY